VHKSDRNYVEAIKCFKNAIRIDGPQSPNSTMILRDLSQMQLQVRDFKGFLDSRMKFLNADRNIQYPSAWVSVALAHHLLENYEQAAKVLQQLRQARSGVEGGPIPILPYELSELYLYEVYIYQDGGMFEKALRVLDKAMDDGFVRDVTGAMELRAQLLASLGRKDEARDAYYELLDENPENLGYHKQIIDMARGGAAGASGTKCNDEAVLVEMYEDLARKYPKSRSCKRIPLDFDLPGDLFKERLRAFVLPYIEKGIPSLFAELEPLYASAEKAKIIGETLAELQNSPKMGKDTACMAFWIRLCLAMHCCRVGRDDEAIQEIDLAIGEAPDDESRIDAYSAKSKILDAVGDYKGAAEMAENARKLDLADRYLNCRASMALFKALQPDRAEEISQMFIKGGNNNFYDMQATWYEMESGHCYAELGDYARALKRFRKVEEHYIDFIDDQYDFFVYCTHKHTLRAYVDMIRMIDGLHKSDILAAAVAAAVRVYIHLSKHPYMTEMEQLENQMATMTPEEAREARERLEEKLRREEKREKERSGEEAKAAAGAKGASDGEQEGGNKVDPDPNGIKLAKTEDPLGDAKKMVNTLLVGAPNHLGSHLLAYKVDLCRALASREISLSLALEHVNSAIRIAGASHPRVHECIVDLAVCSSQGGGADAKDAEDVARAMNELLNSQTTPAYHAAWKADSAPHDLEAVIVAAKTDELLAAADAKEEVWNACALQLHASPEILRTAGHGRCRSTLIELLAEERVGASKLFREACKAVFPLSNVFGAGRGEVPDMGVLNLNA